MLLIIVLFLIVFLGFWIRHSYDLESLRMESFYFEMEQAKTLEGANPKDKIKQMELLLSKFSEGPQKQRAILLLADELYNTRAYDRAIEFYQDITKTFSSSSLPRQLATMGIAHSLEGKGDYKSAIVAYKTFIEHPNKYPLFYIYMSLARCYELNLDNNGALLTLREMKIKFSSHPKFGVIESELKRLDVRA